MKKLFTIVLAAGVLAACSTGSKPEATIEGTVTGIADGTTVYLDSARVKIDSTVVEAGKFRFEMVKAYPNQNALIFEDGTVFPFFVEPGVITATIDTSVEPTAVFAGTPTNDAKKSLDEGTAVFAEQMKEISTQLMAWQQEGKTDTPEFQALAEKFYSTNDQSQQYIKDAAAKQPNTILSAYYMYTAANSLTTPEMVDSVLTLIAGAPANTFTDKLVERRAALAKTAVGAPAPDFTQNQPDGTPLSLSSLKGKLVLIDFWASWCGPCRMENPNVVKLYNAYKDKGFEIIGVSLDNDREAWLKAIEDDGLTWHHVSDLKGWDNAVSNDWAVRAVPHTVLVGADGVIIAKNLRGADLEAKVAEILGEAK